MQILTRAQLIYRITAGMACMLAAIGLVRYAYGPLLPAMLHAKWVDPPSAAYIAGANFGANLLAALLCARLARRWTACRVAQWALLMGVIASVGDAFPLGVWWIGACRVLAGCTAAGIMVLIPVIAVRGVAPKYRGTVVGFLVAGSGAGVIVASLVLPLVIKSGPQNGWLLIGAGTLLCTVFAWPMLRPAPDTVVQTKPIPVPRRARIVLILLLAAYMMFAACSVPHSVFLSAYLHKDLGLSTSAAAMAFVSFGIGLSLGGPMLSGAVAKFVGLRIGAMLSVLLGVVAIAIVLVTQNVSWVIVSGCLLGMAQMGTVPIASVCCLELAGPTGHAAWWARFTAGYTLGVTIGTLIMGAMLSAGFGYIDGFWMAAGFSVVSLALLVLVICIHVNSEDQCQVVEATPAAQR
ncbi:MAG: YbfB/YjiJ family MFS transporter [Phycisphaerales bacterium]|nr:YbfB/YjiJ family MFS transporter [Phycisphaerales bacterium]